MIKKIQTTITGYANKPCSLFSGYDLDKRILVIQVEKPYTIDRKQDCVVITNDKQLERDIFFDESNLHDAITLYFDMLNGVASDGLSKRLVINESLGRARPNTVLEKGDLDHNGQKFSIDQSISNLQIATLATCWYCHSKAEEIEQSISALTQFNQAWKASDCIIYTI